MQFAYRRIDLGSVDLEYPCDMIHRGPADLWLTPRSPIVPGRPPDWNQCVRGDRLVVPLVPYLTSPEPDQALAFMLQLGITCAAGLPQRVRTCHISFATPSTRWLPRTATPTGSFTPGWPCCSANLPLETPMTLKDHHNRLKEIFTQLDAVQDEYLRVRNLVIQLDSAPDDISMQGAGLFLALEGGIQIPLGMPTDRNILADMLANGTEFLGSAVSRLYHDLAVAAVAADEACQERQRQHASPVPANPQPPAAAG